MVQQEAHLYGVLLHGERAVDVVQLVVEAARVADGLALRVAAPQRRGGGAAVDALHARPLRAHLQQTAGQDRRGGPFNPVRLHANNLQLLYVQD